MLQARLPVSLNPRRAKSVDIEAHLIGRDTVRRVCMLVGSSLFPRFFTQTGANDECAGRDSRQAEIPPEIPNTLGAAEFNVLYANCFTAEFSSSQTRIGTSTYRRSLTRHVLRPAQVSVLQKFVSWIPA